MAYKDIIATLGSYTDKKSGEKKYITQKVGTLLDTDKGVKIKLNASFNPAGLEIMEDGCVWLSCFEPRPKNTGGQAAAPRAQRSSQPSASQNTNFDNFDSDIPY